MEITEDHLKIGSKSASKFKYLLDVDELKSCLYVGIFNALRTFDSSKASINTHVYNNVRFECLNQIKFKNRLQYSQISSNAIQESNNREIVDHLELLIDQFVLKLSEEEILKKYDISHSEYIKRLEYDKRYI